MVEEKNPTEDAQSSDSELKSEEGTEEVSEETKEAPEKKEEKKEETDIKALQEKIKNLEKLVGDQRLAENRKKAQELDRLKELEKAKKEGTEKIYRELEEVKFLQAHPEAKEVLEEVKAWANYKVCSLNEAYESKFKKIVEERKASEAQKKEELKNIPPTGEKIAPSDEELKRAVEEANKGNVKPLLRRKTQHLYKEISERWGEK